MGLLCSRQLELKQWIPQSNGSWASFWGISGFKTGILGTRWATDPVINHKWSERTPISRVITTPVTHLDGHL